MNGEIPRPEREPQLYIARAWDRVVTPYVPEYRQLQVREDLNDTFAYYNAAGRYYHTLTHIADCLHKLEPYRARPDYVPLFLALLWHDVIYDTEHGDNEDQSAVMAGLYMANLELPDKPAVKRLIRITASHVSDQEDELLLCDIDLSILGAEPDSYQTYAEGIRQEYAWVDEKHGSGTYNTGRIAVLETLIGDDGQPFKHPDFQHLNGPAVANMRSEQQALLAA